MGLKVFKFQVRMTYALVDRGYLYAVRALKACAQQVAIRRRCRVSDLDVGCPAQLPGFKTRHPFQHYERYTSIVVMFCQRRERLESLSHNNPPIRVSVADEPVPVVTVYNKTTERGNDLAEHRERLNLCEGRTHSHAGNTW